MHTRRDRHFYLWLAVLLVILSALDVATDGAQRPLLVIAAVAGTALLWWRWWAAGRPTSS